MASSAACVSSVWPPSAVDITRAAMGLLTPSASTGLAPSATSSGVASRITTWPTCRPARAFIGTGSVASARW